MSRFDEELRHASASLAPESLPPDILDEALDAPPNRPRWAAMGTVAVGLVAVVMAGGIGIGALMPTPLPTPSVTPSATAEPSEQAVVTCESVAAPAGGGDVVLVFFPCGSEPNLEPISSARSAEVGLPALERLRLAMVALLEGPTEVERDAGLVGVVPGDVEGLQATVDLASDGLAIVDFPEALTEVNDLSTTAAAGAFLRALRATTLQFDEVTAVELRMDGSCDAFFEYIGSAACQHFAEPVSEVSDCPIIAPAELPSGAQIGEPRPYPGQPMVSWGAGDDTVTQLPGHRSGGPAVDGATAVSVRGYPGFVGPAGDLPLPPATKIAWLEDSCSYHVFVRLPGGEEAALEYAARFGPVMTQPSPPPAEPVTVTVEGEGIRLTVMLDRDHTVFGQRIMATTVVQNIGPDSVFWGHSSTCPYPAGLTIRPDEPVRLRPGRDDWPGDAGIVKLVSVNERQAEADPAYRFLPEGWLNREGMGCTSDLVTSELPAGESLVDRSGWDTLAFHDMPPPPGAYTVEAIFAFMSRGEPPTGPEAVDEYTVSLPVPVVIEGPPIDYVSPGEAVDALLSDEGFQNLLADAPRDLWVESRLKFVDDRWELVLYLSASESEPVEAIVGVVEARSGIVIESLREPRTRPQGG